MQTKISDIIKGLNKILTGLYNYYKISFNLKWLVEIHDYVKK